MPERRFSRSRPRWVLRGFLVGLGLLAAFSYGHLSNELELVPDETMQRLYRWARSATKKDDLPSGRWRKARSGAGTLTREQREQMARLQTLGYLSGYERAPEERSVTRYVPSRAQDGLNLYTSGHESVAVLMDMTGAVLHRWNRSFDEAFPHHARPPGKNQQFWRRAHAFENGDLLAIYDGFGMIKLDRASNLLWANAEGFHHDLFVDRDGSIYTLSREARVLPRIHESEPVLEDFVAVLDAEGRVVRRVSLLEAFERSSYASFLEHLPEAGDLFHTNTIERLDGSLAHLSPVFREGNVLVSVWQLDVIAIVDMERETVVWALAGQWQAQHQPTLLENGNMLLFDNRGNAGMSKVIEFDPLTQEVVWAYSGTPENGFYSGTCGSNQRLANGNTLISESDAGRAFELTPDLEIVWEFYNPARAGDDGELIATLFEVLRLPPDFGRDWLHSAKE